MQRYHYDNYKGNYSSIDISETFLGSGSRRNLLHGVGAIEIENFAKKYYIYTYI